MVSPTKRTYNRNKYYLNKNKGICYICSKRKIRNGILCNTCYRRRKINIRRRLKFQQNTQDAESAKKQNLSTRVTSATNAGIN